MSKSERPRSGHLHLEQQRKRAKDLLRAHRSGDRDAAARFRRHLPRAAGLDERAVQELALRLSDAQLVVAREAGFATWPRLKQSLQRASDAERADVELALAAALAGDDDRVRDVVRAAPELPKRSIHVAVAVADAAAALALLEQRPERAVEPFGREAWKPLAYVCFARYGRDDADVVGARVRIAERLIDLGADTNEAAVDWRTPMGRRSPLAAAAEGAASSELVDLLLRKGAKGIVELNARAALDAAIAGGNRGCLQRMLAAKPHWWEVRGGLHAAVERNDLEAARVLLDHGKRLGWETAGEHVERALLLGHVEMIEVLITGGAPLTCRGREGRSLLATAVRTGQSDAAALLRRFGANDLDVDDLDRALGACMLGVSPTGDGSRRFVESDHVLLSWALRRGKAEAVPALLALGLDPNVPDGDGQTPLHLAVATRSIDALSTLLAAGARVGAKNLEAETPLALAQREPRSELREAMVDRLRRAGAASDVEVPVAFELFEEAADAVVDGDLARLRELLDAHPGLATARSRRAHKSTLLHYVGANGVEWERQRSPKNAGRVAELLLERGGAPDGLGSVYGHRDTPLGLAVTSGFPEKGGVMEDIVGALVRGGAKVNGVDDDGGPLTGAIEYGRVSAIRALVSAGARIINVRAAAAVGRLDLVKGFVAAGGDEAKKEDLEQALVHASSFGHAEVVEFLLEKGVDPSAKDHQAFTPLHWAAGNGHVGVVRLLLSRGAPLEVKNIYGGTVLDFTGWAAKNEPGRVDHLPVVELLLAAGADVDAAFPSGDVRVDEVLSRHRAGPDGTGRVKAP